jgi:hypothetical protein
MDVMDKRTDRLLGRVSEQTGIGRAELRDLIETIVDEYLGLIPREQLGAAVERKTGARMVFGDGHAALSYVADPTGTDLVPPGFEPPPGYHRS